MITNFDPFLYLANVENFMTCNNVVSVQLYDLLEIAA